jgi:Ca2+-binding EF-hand superfamily protein
LCFATAAFDFFDSKSKGRITTQDLRSRLSVFYKSLQPREYKFLMSNQPELTFEQLYAMLADNELSNFDPVAEAFKIYDPLETGFIDMSVLTDIFSHLGFGKLTDDDLKVLMEAGDVDRDGRISLEDFRHMLDAKYVELFMFLF